MTEKFSQRLKEMMPEIPSDGWTIQMLLDRFGEQGALLLCMLLTAPFLLPISIPGTSTPFGLLIALLGISLIFQKPPHFPKRLTQKHISQEKMRLLLDKASGLFARLEKMIHPRLPWLSHEHTMGRMNALGIVAGAALLMIPLPLPFSNTIPAYGILFLSLGNLEKDGLAVLLGYSCLAASVAYFGLVAFWGYSGLQALALLHLIAF